MGFISLVDIYQGLQCSRCLLRYLFVDVYIYIFSYLWYCSHTVCYKKRHKYKFIYFHKYKPRHILFLVLEDLEL